MCAHAFDGRHPISTVMASPSTTSPPIEADARLCDEGERLLAAGNFCAAAQRFDRMLHRDPAAQLLRCLARNLAAFEAREPQLADAIATADDTGRFTVMQINASRFAIKRADGSNGFATIDTVGRTIAELTALNEPVTLAGVGNGQLLCHLAAHPPQLHLTQQQAVYVIEPDLSLLRAVCMTQPMWGDDGPIAQRRIHWLIGPSAAERFDHLLDAEPHLPSPTRAIHANGPDEAFINQYIAPAIEARTARQNAHIKQMAEWDREQAADRLAALMGDNPPRPPRVLLLTTRFSTVLQYSMRDTQHAFEQLGWQTHLFIEPAEHHRCTASAVAAAVADFKPDMIFQIDHLRAEFEQVLPKRVPFVCWVQDHLANLTRPEAGESVTDRDFVLTGVRARYERDYAYPRRQMIPLSKLTRMPERIERDDAARDRRVVDDIVYVSNASHRPDDVADRIVADFPRGGTAAAMAQQVCDRMIAVYDRGEALPTPHDIAQLVRQVEADTGFVINSEALRNQFVLRLAQQLNDTLYRQQALHWAAAAADELGLSMGLYGRGWEQHPTLGRFARGTVEYGQPLETLTRQAKINLQIVPFYCLHQRLLDGLAARGFYLVREHPYDIASPATAAWLNTLDDGDDHADWPSELHAFRDQLGWIGEPLQVAREWLAMNIMLPGEPSLPRLNDVTFTTADGLRRRIEQYFKDDEARAAITDSQHAAVAERFSYAAGIRRVIAEVRQRLMEDA